MLRVEHLIKHVRRQTDNESLGTDAGLSDEEIIRYLNDAQEDAFGGIVNTFRSKFYDQATDSIVAGQESYDVPSKAFMGDQLALVEWSITGQDRDYRALKRVTFRERTTSEGWPCRYAVSNGKIYIWPIPQAAQGTLRITYTKKRPKLDKRRAMVDTVTIVGGAITALTVKGSDGAALGSAEGDAFTNDDYMTIINSSGDILCEGIGYDSVSVGGVVTITGGSHTLQSGETCPQDSYVVLGKWATTQPQLPDDLEKYLLAHTAWAVYRRDSNTDQTPQLQALAAMKADILDNYAEMNLDIDYTPQVNDTYDW